MIVVKMLRHKLDQQWSVPRTESTEEEQARVLHLMRNARMVLDSRLAGPTLTMAELMGLKEGDLLAFDYPPGGRWT